MIYNMGAAILRAIGDSRRPVYFLIVSCLVNVVLDLVLVVGLQMGVAGAALATIISQAISAILVLLVLVRTDQPYYHLNIREIRICLPILRALILIGIPAGLQSVLYSISNIIIQSSVNSFGTDVIAAWTAFGKIDGLFWMILGAFGISITTFAGQNFGAQKYGRIRKSVRICLVMATGTAVVLSSLLMLGGEYVYRIFTSDAAVIERGIEVLHLLVPFYFTYVCVEVLSGAVRGAGDAIIPMVITSLGICALRVTWVLVVVPMFPTLSTLVLSYPITWSVTSLLFIVYYLQGGWLRRAIARAGFPPEGAKSPSGE